ncbi:hypothetical protein [Ahniella affigens]|nr:hypothetical protein [Ahniella affigens]
MSLNLITVLTLGAGNLVAAAPPALSASSSIELRMADCGGEDEDRTLREIITKNARFDVIDRYGEPLQVVKHVAWRKQSNCMEGSEGKVDFEVTLHPRDGSAASKPLRFNTEGEEPLVLAYWDWPMLRVTQAGCCGSEDGYRYFDPNTGKLVGVSSVEPLPLQVINNAADSGLEQGTIQRYVFAHGATSAAFDAEAATGQEPVAELTFSGPDHAPQRVLLQQPVPSNDAESGPWSVRAMRFVGEGIDEQGRTLWVDGGPPKTAQVDGLTLELDVECQCEAEPRTLRVRLSQDRLVDTGLKAQHISLVPMR